MSQAAYVVEDGLVDHHWKERTLGLANFICSSVWECQGQEVGVGALESRGRGKQIGDFRRGNQERA